MFYKMCRCKLLQTYERSFQMKFSRAFQAFDQSVRATSEHYSNRLKQFLSRLIIRAVSNVYVGTVQIVYYLFGSQKLMIMDKYNLFGSQKIIGPYNIYFEAKNNDYGQIM